MFNCSLCRAQCDEWVVMSTHCSKCEQIRRIISLYDVDKVLSTLRFVYLRDEYDKIEKREGVECKKNEEDNKTKAEKAEKSDIQTRSQKKNNEDSEKKK
jgi:hypothetical protein